MVDWVSVGNAMMAREGLPTTRGGELEREVDAVLRAVDAELGEAPEEGTNGVEIGEATPVVAEVEAGDEEAADTLSVVLTAASLAVLSKV